jgi:hypothetical protein
MKKEVKVKIIRRIKVKTLLGTKMSKESNQG